MSSLDPSSSNPVCVHLGMEEKIKAVRPEFKPCVVTWKHDHHVHCEWSCDTFAYIILVGLADDRQGTSRTHILKTQLCLAAEGH